MVRLLDLGKDRISNIMIEMAELSEHCVTTAIDSYEKGLSAKNQIFQWSEELRVLQNEVSELAIELIARYQPVASDLRFIRSCMEISYGFSRFGRYAYDIVDVLETMGSVSHCDKKPVLDMACIVTDMIRQSVQALRSNDEGVAEKLYQMDNGVDALYRKRLREVITPSQPPSSTVNSDEVSTAIPSKVPDPRCHVSALLIMRYLERISDHACYIADSVHYIVTGSYSPRH